MSGRRPGRRFEKGGDEEHTPTIEARKRSARMLQDLRIKRLAETLVHYSLKIKEGDLLLIQGSDLAAPLMREVYREALPRRRPPRGDGLHPGPFGDFLPRSQRQTAGARLAGKPRLLRKV